MLKRSVLIVLAAVFVATPAVVSCQPENGPHDAVKIILVGDSTTAQASGWGGAFCDVRVSSMVACLPMGRGGRSTKTYRAEGNWQLVLNEMKVAGYKSVYVLIEMGHNDKNADPSIGTNLHNEFSANLARFVAETRAAGATPILVTPLSMRRFQNGVLADSLAPWADAVRTLSGHLNVKLVDLNKASEALYSEMGAVKTLEFETRGLAPAEVQSAMRGTTLPARVGDGAPVSSAVPKDDPRRNYGADYVHLNDKGAHVIASLMAGLLLQTEPGLSRFVRR